MEMFVFSPHNGVRFNGTDGQNFLPKIDEVRTSLGP